MERIKLVATLELASRALATNDMVPVFKHFCFKDGLVVAYNDEMAVVAECDVEGTFALPGAALLSLLKASSAPEVSFKVGETDVTITAGKSKFKLGYLTEDAFLFAGPVTAGKEAIPLSQAFMTGIKNCLVTVARDQSMQAMMGVAMKKTALWSCDGDAVTESRLTGEWPDVFLPNAFCETLLKVWDNHYEVGGLVAVDGWIVAAFNGLNLYHRLPDNKKPLDHQKLMKDTLGGVAADFVDATFELKEALTRARVLADPESAKTEIVVNKGVMTLTTSTPTGTVTDTVVVKGHQNVSARVSAALVQRSLSVCPEFMVVSNCCVFRNGDTLLQLCSNME